MAQAIQTRRHVLIVENNHHGHRLYYVKLLASAALAAGDSVTIGTSAEALKSEEFALHLRALLRSVEVQITKGPGFRRSAEVAEAIGADHVVIADGDHSAMQIGLYGRRKLTCTVSILVMREVAQPSGYLTKAKTRVRSALFHRAARAGGVRVYFLKSASSRQARDDMSLPDPVTFEATAASIERIRTEVGLSGKTTWFGVVGAITERKNLPIVGRAIRQLANLDVGLVVAGRQSDEAVEICRALDEDLRGSGVKLLVIDRLLTDSDIDSLIGALDCIVAAHSNEGPSGILSKSLAAGTPVVAAGAQSLKRDAIEAPDSVSWAPLEENCLAGALANQIPARRCQPIAPSSEAFTAKLLGLSQ